MPPRFHALADMAAAVVSDLFGTTATYVLAAGGSTPGIVGVFHSPHLTAVVGEVGVSDLQPTFTCRSPDLPVGAQGGDAGDTITIDAETFRVIDLQPDGVGGTVITLGAQS